MTPAILPLSKWNGIHANSKVCRQSLISVLFVVIKASRSSNAHWWWINRAYCAVFISSCTLSNSEGHWPTYTKRGKMLGIVPSTRTLTQKATYGMPGLTSKKLQCQEAEKMLLGPGGGNSVQHRVVLQAMCWLCCWLRDSEHCRQSVNCTVRSNQFHCGIDSYIIFCFYGQTLETGQSIKNAGLFYLGFQRLRRSMLKGCIRWRFSVT